MSNQAHQNVHHSFSGYAAFVSAPTLEFARMIMFLDSLPPDHKSTVAASVLQHMHGVADVEDDGELGMLAQYLQSERWKLLYDGANDLENPVYAAIVVTEHWVRAQQTFSPKKSKMAQALAEERLKLIKMFLSQNLVEEGQIQDGADGETTAIAA
jgi:hypothetical protein